ncbi:uncharacterized protein MELLADRAFT_73463 [Melampsora larici-populina 98AG31]|uniref:Uncharacterized protein n=1 Tax=Melampsora larici-populina (strain 98AG31 / pathotype 3-4-7) TaxID=747676 RepID=F4S8J9_MELLP|nr:uncharacterized protein MELLADRAFT_73463 [Melampsora larici-populina 98AG31]EGF99058.1 hypothetical protein MELLADRAFT_73463 [Melampsora larici-populina 98AG31]
MTKQKREREEEKNHKRKKRKVVDPILTTSEGKKKEQTKDISQYKQHISQGFFPTGQSDKQKRTQKSHATS